MFLYDDTILYNLKHAQRKRARYFCEAAHAISGEQFPHFRTWKYENGGFSALFLQHDHC